MVVDGGSVFGVDREGGGEEVFKCCGSRRR